MEQKIIQALRDLRAKNPLVHNITNFVVMNNTANALLAIGASPMMVHGHKEVETGVEVASSLVINVGTLDDYWAESMLKATKRANSLQKPWILDPVGAGLSTFRNEVLRQLISYRPTVIRGNASEIMALHQFSKTGGKGVDSTNTSDQALEAAKALNSATGSIVCISGEVDYIVGDHQIIAANNGHSLMTKVTGLGCSSTAVIGGFIGLNSDPYLEAVSGVALFSLAGELAFEQAKGPGSLQVELYDALFNLNETTILKHIRVREHA